MGSYAPSPPETATRSYPRGPSGSSFVAGVSTPVEHTNPMASAATAAMRFVVRPARADRPVFGMSRILLRNDTAHSRFSMIPNLDAIDLSARGEPRFGRERHPPVSRFAE